MTYVAAQDRYEQMSYRRCGRSGIDLPEISLGLWHNFGTERPLEIQRAILRRAFDLGVTHFDLANNYGRWRPESGVNPTGAGSGFMVRLGGGSDSSGGVGGFRAGLLVFGAVRR